MTKALEDRAVTGISVIVKGGANVAQPKTFVTPNGVITRVSQEDYEFLMADAKFQNFMAKGFMSIIGDDQDLETAARDMVKKDKSAPKTPGDYGSTGGNISVGAAKAA